MMTVVPTGPKVGVNEVIVGTPVLVTVNLWELQAVPPGVVTQIFPVVAAVGTVAVVWVGEATLSWWNPVELHGRCAGEVRSGDGADLPGTAGRRRGGPAWRRSW